MRGSSIKTLFKSTIPYGSSSSLWKAHRGYCSSDWKVYRTTNIFSFQLLVFKICISIERQCDPQNKTIELLNYWIIYHCLLFIDTRNAQTSTNWIMCDVWMNDLARMPIQFLLNFFSFILGLRVWGLKSHIEVLQLNYGFKCSIQFILCALCTFLCTHVAEYAQCSTIYTLYTYTMCYVWSKYQNWCCARFDSFIFKWFMHTNSYNYNETKNIIFHIWTWWKNNRNTKSVFGPPSLPVSIVCSIGQFFASANESNDIHMRIKRYRFQFEREKKTTQIWKGPIVNSSMLCIVQRLYHNIVRIPSHPVHFPVHNFIYRKRSTAKKIKTFIFISCHDSNIFEKLFLFQMLTTDLWSRIPALPNDTNTVVITYIIVCISNDVVVF